MKNVLVTGASRGLGLAILRRLLADPEGYRVVGLSRSLSPEVAALVLQVIVSVAVFGMPVSAAGGAGLLGLLTALWPIAYIVVLEKPSLSATASAGAPE